MTVCGLLTDSSVDFPPLNAQDRKSIHVIPFRFMTEDAVLGTNPAHIADFYRIADQRNHFSIPEIPRDDLFNTFQILLRTYAHLFCIFSSGQISNAYQYANQTLETFTERDRISILDSQSISTGLGNLCTIALNAIRKNKTLLELENDVRQAIASSYFVVCTPSPSYLFFAGLSDLPQSLAGQVLSLCPILSLEEGNFRILHKLKNIHGISDIFIDFLSEFDSIKSVALISTSLESRKATSSFRQYCENAYAKNTFCEIQTTPFLASLFGPDCIALSVVEA
jgi:DegV family protein with EDD domain